MAVRQTKSKVHRVQDNGNHQGLMEVSYSISSFFLFVRPSETLCYMKIGNNDSRRMAVYPALYLRDETVECGQRTRPVHRTERDTTYEGPWVIRTESLPKHISGDRRPFHPRRSNRLCLCQTLIRKNIHIDDSDFYNSSSYSFSSSSSSFERTCPSVHTLHWFCPLSTVLSLKSFCPWRNLQFRHWL